MRRRDDTTTETDDRAIAKPECQLKGRVDGLKRGSAATCSPRGQDETKRYQAAGRYWQTNKIISECPHEIDANPLERGAAEVDCSPHVAQAVAHQNNVCGFHGGFGAGTCSAE